MTATEIIREMDSLPPAELAVVVLHAKKLEEVRQLSPDEIGDLLDQFVESTEVERLREEITEGLSALPHIHHVPRNVRPIIRSACAEGRKPAML